MTKAIEKKKVVLEMAMDNESSSEAWRALTTVAAETQEASYDRVKNKFESIKIETSESPNISPACTLS